MIEDTSYISVIGEQRTEYTIKNKNDFFSGINIMNLKKGLLAAISLGLLSVTTAPPTLAQAAVVVSSSDAPTYLTQGKTIVSFRRILSDGERGRDRDRDHDRDRDRDHDRHDRDRDHHDRDRDHNHR